MDDLGGIKLIQASELTSGIVRGAVAYWQSKRNGDAPPLTSSLDPLEVPSLLPHLMLKEVRRDPWDFRYRVIGSTVRAHSRDNWTGKWMSEVEGQGEGSTVFRVMRWVSEGGQPAIFRPPYVGPHKEYKYCEAAVLPWCNGAGLVDRVLVAVDFLMA